MPRISDETGSLPLGCVLTLPATGSEMNGNALISNAERGAKRAFSSPHCLPRFSVLDPGVTASLPRRQIANGLVDAFVHVLEQHFTSRQAGELQSAQAEAVRRTLISIAAAGRWRRCRWRVSQMFLPG